MGPLEKWYIPIYQGRIENNIFIVSIRQKLLHKTFISVFAELGSNLFLINYIIFFVFVCRVFTVFKKVFLIIRFQHSLYLFWDMFFYISLGQSNPFLQIIIISNLFFLDILYMRFPTYRPLLLKPFPIFIKYF